MIETELRLVSVDNLLTKNLEIIENNNIIVEIRLRTFVKDFGRISYKIRPNVSEFGKLKKAIDDYNNIVLKCVIDEKIKSKRYKKLAEATEPLLHGLKSFYGSENYNNAIYELRG